MRDKKVLLVTGASSDVGVALIRRVGANYTTIVAHYHHSSERLEELNREQSGKIFPIQADFSEENSTKAFLCEVAENGLLPDHFVHLASLPLRNIKFPKTVWPDFEQELSVSFRAAVLCGQAFLPHMAKQRYGKVVFMLSSYVVNQPSIKFAIPYSSAKYALLGLMKGLSAEYAEKGVTVNGISPSMIETKFLSNIPQLIVEKNAMESPLRRNLQVEDILSAFEFLLSNGADCVTGQNLAVTGGN